MLKITFRVDSISLHYEAITYSFQAFIGEIGGVAKAMMLVGGTITSYITHSFFMSDVLKELFLVKQSVDNDEKDEDSAGSDS